MTYSQYPDVRERLINLPNFDNKVIHYGYFLGVNQYDFKFEYIPSYYTELKYKDVAVEQKKGFSVTQGPVATKGNCREFVSNVAVGKEYRKLRGTACRENNQWIMKEVY